MKSKFNEALSFFQKGQLDEAKKICLKILKEQPDNFNVLHLLGVIAFKEKDYVKSEDLIEKAIKIKPNQVEIYNFYALILVNLKKFNLAIKSWDEAIKLKPDYAEAYNNKGNILFVLKKNEDALESYEKAIQIKPDYADAYNNRGNPLRKLKKINAALESYEKAIEHNPNHAEAYNNKGNIFLESERTDSAIKSYEKVIEIKPNHAQAHNNLGIALHKSNKNEAALESYERAIKIKPDYAEAHYNKANILYELEKIDESLESYERAIKIKPDYAEAYFNKGGVLLALNVNGEALTNFKKVLEIKPDFESLSGTMMYTKLKLCNWENFNKDLENLKDVAADSEKKVNPHNLLFCYDSLKIQRSAAKKWSDIKFSSIPLNQQQYQSQNPLNSNEDLYLTPKREINKKIKIGYYSADLREHAVGQLIVNLFELHDKSKFEIFGFYFGPDVNDDVYKRISNSTDKFINVKSKNETEIVQLSRDFGIDIAVDLMGYTSKNRFKIFAERCAPLQVSYLGYPGTTGANYIDYLIADKILIPKESQEYYSEKIIYLPNTFLVNDSAKKISKKIFTREELNLPKNDFVFCCFNQSYKILPKTFDIWMRILKRVKGSVLWLFNSNEISCKNLKQEAVKRDVDPNRIIFANRLPLLEEHLARYKAADLFLDTLPYTAHSTCSDSLEGGLPVLTLQGETYASRVSSSLLNVLDLKELITHSSKEYEDVAVELASDLSKLKDIKNKLDVNKNKTPLFNTKLFTSHIEKAYLEMNKKYIENKKLENIEIK